MIATANRASIITLTVTWNDAPGVVGKRLVAIARKDRDDE